MVENTILDLDGLFARVKKSSENRSGVSPYVPHYNENSTAIKECATWVANEFSKRQGVLSSSLEAIGWTPMIELKRIAEVHNLKCRLLAKVEYFNLAGSVKDRIGLRMLERLEAEGKIKKGDVVIEATSGNTGCGVAAVCAVKGYQAVITMPEKMSMEKEYILRALGAKVYRTRTTAMFSEWDSHISLAYQLKDAVNNSGTGIHAFIPDQYKNPGNLEAHYFGTADEIIQQTNGNITAFVAAAGTGGTITGVAHRLKEKVPGVTIVCVDPKGSILKYKKGSGVDPKQESIPYEVEGIGYDFHPQTYHHETIDQFYSSTDQESFDLAMELAQKEALLCGGSAGSALAGALNYAKSLGPDDTVVVLFSDSMRNYTSKFVSHDWRLAAGLLTSPNQHCQYKGPNFVPAVHIVNQAEPINSFIPDSLTVEEAYELNSRYLVIQQYAGLLSQDDLATLILGGKAKDQIRNHLKHSLYSIEYDDNIDLEELRLALNVMKNGAVLVKSKPTNMCHLVTKDCFIKCAATFL